MGLEHGLGGTELTSGGSLGVRELLLHTSKDLLLVGGGLVEGDVKLLGRLGEVLGEGAHVTGLAVTSLGESGVRGLRESGDLLLGGGLVLVHELAEHATGTDVGGVASVGDLDDLVALGLDLPLMRIWLALSEMTMADTTWMSPRRRVSCCLILEVRATISVVKYLRAFWTSLAAAMRAALMFLTVVEKRESARADCLASWSLRLATAAPMFLSRVLRSCAIFSYTLPNLRLAHLRADSTPFSTVLTTLV